MIPGVDRVDVLYEWPRTLLVPERPPKLIYLDLNHWIALAKANSGHSNGERYREVLSAAIEAVSQHRAIFPISDSIYMEVAKITLHRQRQHLRHVIELLSRFVVVTSRSIVSVHEIEAVLDRIVGPSPKPINQMLYVDWGVARAFGMVGGFRVKNGNGVDITDDVRAEWTDGPGSFDALLASAELDLNRKTLEGPTTEEEPAMRADGWDPRSAFKVAETRALQEVEQVERFNSDPAWRRGRIRDVVAAREVLIEINEHLAEGLNIRGRTLSEAIGSPEEARRAFDSMPSFDVAVTLKASCHRDPNHHWTPNDIHDIDALGSTLPYCDVVVTDKAMARNAIATGLGDRLGTVVLSSLLDLPPQLEGPEATGR